MSTHTSGRVPSPTYLLHHFGRGLVDEHRTYAVERFRAMIDGDVRRWPLDERAGGRGRPRPEVATFDEVREMRPAHNEIIVCTAIGTHSGLQFWGSSSTGLFAERRQRR